MRLDEDFVECTLLYAAESFTSLASDKSSEMSVSDTLDIDSENTPCDHEIVEHPYSTVILAFTVIV
jgi:hypothetical protein